MLLRYAIFAALAVGAVSGQPQLAIVRPVLTQAEGDPGLPAGHLFVPGETIFFSCMVSGYKASAEDKKIDLVARVRAVDSKGVLLDEPFDKEIKAELTAEDKNWMPRVNTSILLPSLIFSGTYKFVVSVEDKLAAKTVSLDVPFQVGGRGVQPSDTLTVRNFRFLKGENDTTPLKDAIYHPGESLWAKFDITGFKYGPKNHVKLSYGVRVVNAAGREIYNHPEAANEDSDSFYPKQYLPGEISLSLNDQVEKTSYTILVEIRDEIGNQTYEEKQPFRIE